MAIKIKDTLSELAATNYAVTGTSAEMTEFAANVGKIPEISAMVVQDPTSVFPAAGYYNCYSEKFNRLGEVADGSKICLKEYAFGKNYAIRFTTPDNHEVRLQFYKDEGSGPALMTGDINEKYAFPMAGSYVIEVKFENIDVRPDGWTGNRQKMTFRTVDWVEDETEG